MEDLWPELDIDEHDRESPLSILKMQAELLGSKTRNVVTAHIEINDEQNIPFPFSYSFYLKSNSIKYSYLLFDIGFYTSIWPVYLFNINHQLKMELKGSLGYMEDTKISESGAGLSATTMDEFKTILSNIFKSDNVRGLIQLLYDQSKIISRKI